MQMNASIARAALGALLSLSFSIGCAFISVDYYARRGLELMAAIWAFASIVATAALILRIVTLRRLIKRR